jgi:hypothetical protein
VTRLFHPPRAERHRTQTVQRTVQNGARGRFRCAGDETPVCLHSRRGTPYPPLDRVLLRCDLSQGPSRGSFPSEIAQLRPRCAAV